MARPKKTRTEKQRGPTAFFLMQRHSSRDSDCRNPPSPSAGLRPEQRTPPRRDSRSSHTGRDTTLTGLPALPAAADPRPLIRFQSRAAAAHSTHPSLSTPVHRISRTSRSASPRPQPVPALVPATPPHTALASFLPAHLRPSAPPRPKRSGRAPPVSRPHPRPHPSPPPTPSRWERRPRATPAHESPV